MKINKWTNRNNKVRQKEYKEQMEVQGYFKPKVSESSKQMALKKRKEILLEKQNLSPSDNKIEQAREESTVDLSLQDSIFDRLYNEAKIKKQNLESNREKYHTASSFSDTNPHYKFLNPRSRSHKRKKPITNPSFNISSKVSPITSVEQLYPPSPRMKEENARYIMNQYLSNSSKPLKKGSQAQNNTVSGGGSPIEFITWNESKYN